MSQLALITGASTGIGFELGKLFARDGYNLVIVARSAERLEKAASEFRTISGADVRAASKPRRDHSGTWRACLDDRLTTGFEVEGPTLLRFVEPRSFTPANNRPAHPLFVRLTQVASDIRIRADTPTAALVAFRAYREAQNKL